MHETVDLIHLALTEFAPHAMGKETHSCPICGHEDNVRNYNEPPTKQDVEDWLTKKQQKLSSQEKIYRGQRTLGSTVVTVNGQPLPMRRDLADHAYTFEWGYSGSGPAQLALAILADCVGGEKARKWAYSFKGDVIAKLPSKGWTLHEGQIRAQVDLYEGFDKEAK